MTIQALNLSKAYEKVLAVNDVTFNVGPGEVVGIIGPNGAGKTTILRILVGILRPTSGSARVAGFDSATESIKVKANVGFLSGDTKLYDRLTPREVLEYFSRLNKLSNSQTRIDELVDLLAMGDFQNQRCGTLSSGQKQRANLARAFLHDPPVLILDEPTVALDVVSGKFVMDFIQHSRSLGRAVLFSTHIMGEAELVCDRVLFIYEGSIIETGTVAEVCEAMDSPGLTGAFMTAVERADASVGSNSTIGATRKAFP